MPRNRLFKSFTLVAMMAVMSLDIANAITADSVPHKKRTTLGLYLTADEAYQLKTREDVLFIDVRSRAEIAFLGMPTMSDANIPYMVVGDWSSWDAKKQTFKMQANSDFLTRMDDLVARHAMGKDSKIVLMCRSGGRSAKAANLLAKAGYTRVYSIIDGFEGDNAREGAYKGQRVVNGWKNSGLPWSYKLDQAKMYGDFLD